MATKAERYRVEVQRERARERAAARGAAGKKQPKASPKPKTTRNRLERAPRAVYELEESMAKRPSRKSSRKSSNRQKAGAQLKAKRTMQAVSPQGRHDRKSRGGRGR